MKYLIRQKGKVGFRDRCAQYEQKPVIFWFTGLSGAGKTTIAIEFEKKLFDYGRIVFHLDADDLRKKLNADLSFSMEDRAENIRRAAEVARLLQDAGVIVLSTFISPTCLIRQQVREIARQDLFVEVYVKARLETCIKRDPKGYYKKALKGKIKNYTGLHSGYEEPENPDLVLDTDTDGLDKCLEKLMEFAHKKGAVQS